MVRLRLQRFGKKKKPIYRIVVTDKRMPRNGAYLESVGQYNPNFEPAKIDFKENRILYWLKAGAQPSETVRSILKRKGLWLKWTLLKQGKEQEKIQTIMERWQMLQEEKVKRTADRKVRRTMKKKQQASTPADTQASPVGTPVS